MIVFVPDFTDGITELTHSATELTVSVPDFTDSITDLTDAVMGLTHSAPDFTDAVAPSTNGVTDFTDSIADFTDAVTDFTNSALELTRSVTELTDAAVQKATVSGKRAAFASKSTIFGALAPIAGSNPTKTNRPTWHRQTPLGTARTPRAIHCAGGCRA